MKTEQTIEQGIERLRTTLPNDFKQAMYDFQSEDYNECLEKLHTIVVNVAAMEAAVRILDKQS